MSYTPRLDRLSALLEGLLPRIEVDRPALGKTSLNVAAETPAFLHLYLLSEGEMRLQIELTGSHMLKAPCIVVCRSDTAHALSALSSVAFKQLMCARAFLDGPVATLLLDEFVVPQIVLLNEAEPSLCHVVSMIASELEEPRCGQPALLNRAGDILFIGLLRHLIAHPKSRHGLLSGLADSRIARSLVAIHANPQRDWTLESLAAEAGMSRTSFANTFRTIMRETPGRYLSSLRLSVARRAVRFGKGLKVAAQSAGYKNTSALSRALSRVENPSG